MEWSIGYWQISIQRTYPTIQQLRQTYNAAAPTWNRLVDRLGISRAYTQLFRSLQDQVLDHIKDNANGCDCGIGTAAFSLALAKVINSDINLVGIDISPEMLGKAQQLLTQAGIQPQLCQSDVNHLPLDDNQFDLVISAHMLEHLVNPTQGLRAMVRILRPGAPIILAVTRPGLLSWWIEWHWGNRCFSLQEVIRMMSEAGLIQIQVYPFTNGLARWTSTVYVGFKD